MASDVARIHRTSLGGNAHNGADFLDQTSSSVKYLPLTPSKSGELSGYVPRMRDFTPPYPRADAYRATFGSSFSTDVELLRCSRVCNQDDCCIASLAEQMARSMLNDDHEEEAEPKNFCDQIFDSEAASSEKFYTTLPPNKLDHLEQVKHNWSTRACNSRSSVISDHNFSPDLPSLNPYYAKEDKCPTLLQRNEISRLMLSDASTALRHRNLVALTCREWEALTTSTSVRSKIVPRMSSSQNRPSFELLDSMKSSSTSCIPTTWKSNHSESSSTCYNRRPTEDDFKYSNINLFKQHPSFSWNRLNKVQQQNPENMRSSHRKSQDASVSSISHCRSVQFNGGGSGMRAVFLGGRGAGRESIGTGVFLPRCRGVGNVSKRKPGKVGYKSNGLASLRPVNLFF
ncbi:hypothetical protein O6H91_17G036100 [Diphasiastrum complanatum]|uniref:Uncharacterized protein n=3 Tax=Diphasiastrum complanatum TaxID=34168 RepID=A0ACC2B5R1_DIPCM|nr:hypothetical protein O6H91_17G036100 [Diphasiastrum complanatum]KAJ7525093.1 hypothetical protein O6H91_17G036100 [Diphasiastrum complanatum]KAJ7525094.1 hypothetical protein O6H91_17G036100 [Diphasiastrum complanatum]